MWMAEAKWGLTASVLAMLHNVNRAKGDEAAKQDDYNPFAAGRESKPKVDVRLTPRESVLFLARALCRRQRIPEK